MLMLISYLALALSLAINDVFPSAIYLFDEIDASLDQGGKFDILSNLFLICYLQPWVVSRDTCKG